MKRVTLLLGVLLAGVFGLAGCGAQSATPDAAVPVAQAFLKARALGNAGAMQRLLTDRTQQAITQSSMVRFLNGETFSFGTIGPATAKEPGWVQVAVRDVTIRHGAVRSQWPELRLTLHHNGKRWRVAWVDSLADEGLNAYQNGRFGDELAMAEAISQIDPYHYRGPLEYHYAYRGLARLREADFFVHQAAALATPEQAPDVDDAMARFKLSLQQPQDAAKYARAALDKAAPEIYPPRWRADTLVVLGRALLASGDRAGAAQAAEQAATFDPENASMALLRIALTKATP